MQSGAKAGGVDSTNGVGQGFEAELMADDLEPGGAEVEGEAAEQYRVGAEEIGEIGDHFADGAGVDLDHLGGVSVAGAPERGEVFGSRRGGPAMGEFPGGDFAEGCAGTEGLDAAAFAESFGAVVAEAGVADLQALAAGAAIDFAVEDQARAEARAAGEIDQPRRAAAGAPEEFGKTTGSGVMLDAGWKAEAIGDDLLERDVVPAGEIRRGLDDSALGVERAADGCAGGDDTGMVVNQLVRLGAQVFDHGLRAAMAEGWPLSSMEDLSIVAADDRGAFGAADVQAEEEIVLLRGHDGELTKDWARAVNSGASHQPSR